MNNFFCIIALFASLTNLLADPLERFLADPALKSASVGFAMIPLTDPKKITENTEACRRRISRERKRRSDPFSPPQS